MNTHTHSGLDRTWPAGNSSPRPILLARPPLVHAIHDASSAASAARSGRQCTGTCRGSGRRSSRGTTPQTWGQPWGSGRRASDLHRRRGSVRGEPRWATLGPSTEQASPAACVAPPRQSRAASPGTRLSARSTHLENLEPTLPVTQVFQHRSVSSWMLACILALARLASAQRPSRARAPRRTRSR